MHTFYCSWSVMHFVMLCLDPRLSVVATFVPVWKKFSVLWHSRAGYCRCLLYSRNRSLVRYPIFKFWLDYKNNLASVLKMSYCQSQCQAHLQTNHSWYTVKDFILALIRGTATSQIQIWDKICFDRKAKMGFKLHLRK